MRICWARWAAACSLRRASRSSAESGVESMEVIATYCFMYPRVFGGEFGHAQTMPYLQLSHDAAWAVPRAGTSRLLPASALPKTSHGEVPRHLLMQPSTCCQPGKH